MKFLHSALILGMLLLVPFAYATAGRYYGPISKLEMDTRIPDMGPGYAEAWFGGTEASAIGESGALQIACAGVGGCWVMEIWFSHLTAQSNGQRIHVAPTGTDPLADDVTAGTNPTIFNIGTGSILSTITKGTTDVIFDGTHPTLSPGVSGGAHAGWPLRPFYLKTGSLLTIKSNAAAEDTNWAVRLREVEQAPTDFAQAMSGGSCGAAASKGGAIQLDCQGPGGCWVDDIWLFQGGTTTGWRIDVSIAGTDPLSADAIDAGDDCSLTEQVFDLGTVPAVSTIAFGRTTVNLDDETPTLDVGLAGGVAAGLPLKPFFMPSGALLTVKTRADNEHADWLLIWREVL